MDASTHPGKGLSIPQLIFALKKELERVKDSPSFALEAISQIDRDASTVLATIREWRNSLVPINRIPLDVLSLIPTHLPSQKDRFIATFVCRHWRRVFLDHSPLWYQVILQKGEGYVETLLDRARGSALEIVVESGVPFDTMVPFISPRAPQIERLKLFTSWVDIKKVSEWADSESPPLRTLTIDSEDSEDDQTDDLGPPPSSPFFGRAVDLEEFIFYSGRLDLLPHFVFTNLTTFRLSVEASQTDISGVLDFLEASPKLNEVAIRLGTGTTSPRGLDDATDIVLPGVKTFSILVVDGPNVFDIATHIVCPSVGNTSVGYRMTDGHMNPDWEIFSPGVMWSTITPSDLGDRRGPIEEVVVDVGTLLDPCSLTFRFSDTSVFKQEFKVIPTTEDWGSVAAGYKEMFRGAFTQACETITSLPHLTTVKRLQIRYRKDTEGINQAEFMPGRIDGLFKTVGSLEALTLDGCDPFVFFASLLHPDRVADLELESIALPPINQLTILHPIIETGEHGMKAVLRLAKSRNLDGKPFNCITIRAKAIPMGMEEQLGRWAGSANCYEEEPVE